MTCTRLVNCIVIVLASFIGVGPAIGPVQAKEPSKAQIDALRQKLKKYQDPYVAVRDLYLSTVGCVRYSGELQSVLHIK